MKSHFRLVWGVFSSRMGFISTLSSGSHHTLTCVSAWSLARLMWLSWLQNSRQAPSFRPLLEPTCERHTRSYKYKKDPVKSHAIGDTRTSEPLDYWGDSVQRLPWLQRSLKGRQVSFHKTSCEVMRGSEPTLQRWTGCSIGACTKSCGSTSYTHTQRADELGRLSEQEVDLVFPVALTCWSCQGWCWCHWCWKGVWMEWAEHGPIWAPEHRKWHHWGNVQYNIH